MCRITAESCFTGEIQPSVNIRSVPGIQLTSRDSKQYQQNACLQFLHIICAQPSSLSM